MTLYGGYRHSRFTYHPARSAVWSRIAGYLQRYVPPEGTLVELGSGYCDFVNSIHARRRWAVDLYVDPAEFAGEGVTPLSRDVAELGEIPDAGVDVVFASNLLEHLPDQKIEKVMEEVRRVLRPGGRFIAIQPNFRHCYRTYFDDYTHCRVFSHVSLADLLKAQGFSIERVAHRFLPFSMKERLPKWGWLVWLYLRSPWKPFAAQMLVIARKPPDP